MKLSILLILLTISLFQQSKCDESGEIANYIFKEIAQNNIFTNNPEIQEILNIILEYNHQNFENNDFYPLCSPCKLLFTLVQKQPLSDLNSILKIVATAVCTYAKLYPFHVCLGAVNEMAEFIVESVWLHYTEPDFICPGIKLCKPVYEYINITQKIENITRDTPQLPQPVPKKDKIIKVLHFTDIHTDLEYEVGKNQNCPDPICCRFINGDAKKEEDKAGKWGSRNCDLPEWTVEQTLRFIKNNLNSEFDFCLWTGDNTAHDMKNFIQNKFVITERFKKYFPNKKFFPQMGNHESFPVNVYDYFGKREQDLIDSFSEIWEEWIGKDAAKQEKELGFYASYYKEYNLKVIGINTQDYLIQACNDQNWYLLRNPTDPFNQLDWMEKELLDSEQKKQLVFIISHIPSSSCLEPWGSIYNALITRFQHTIRGQYFGHTHDDRIEFNRDIRTNDKIIGYNMQAGSLTPSGKNPTFRILHLDAETLQVIDYVQYRLDLEKWNKYPESKQIIFDNVYNFTTEYNVPDMWNFTQIAEFQDKLRTDLDIFNKFNYNVNKGVYTNKTQIDESTYCETFPTKSLKSECHHGKYKPSVFEEIAGEWRIKREK